MKYLFLVYLFINSFFLFAQVEDLKKASIKGVNILHSQKNISIEDVSIGIRAALKQGSVRAVDLAHKKNEFTNNKHIRITFPSEVSVMKNILLKVGMKNEIIKMEKKMNVAAEMASGKAIDILLKSINQLSISQAVEILNGDDNAATNYMKSNCEKSLFLELKPIINQVMNQSDSKKHWNFLIKKYNRIPYTKEINFDIEEFITLKTIEGLFYLIAEEENNIRSNSQARSSDILQKVFN